MIDGVQHNEVRTRIIDPVVYWRGIATLISIVVPLGFLLLAVLLRICKSPICCFGDIQLTFFWGIIIWISFTIHLLVYVVLDDVCDVVNNTLPTTGNSTLAVIFSCAQGDSTNNIFQMFTGDLDQTQESLANATCSVAQSICNAGIGATCSPAIINACDATVINQLKTSVKHY